MRYRIGRIIQVIGLFVIVPQAIVLEVLEKVSLGQSMLIAIAGAVVFILGVGIQRSAGR